jgi:glycosyltransferase involved in cell wall biosynthesis
MAAGCIPIVINKGGQKEIIKEGENGFKFEDFHELKEKTLQVINNHHGLESLKKNAVRDSRLFSNEVFEEKLLEIINETAKAVGKGW